ncbi:MAG: peptidyl-prolyl cis-trans isomerase [Flavobacteriales bacterium]|jgi:hypothetical protein|nr:peptidyl-prolyl cis-trans isomerase [Flavobacteriales bacterium]
MRKLLYICVMCSLLVACDYFKQDTEKIPVARVNDTFLYEEDIKALLSEDASEEDSTLIVSSYITRWATQQLLIDQAKINLSEDKLESYDKLVREYKNDLYTEAYKNVIVSKQLDSTVSEEEFIAYYEQNKDNFKLNDDLVKVRYIHVIDGFTNLAATKQKFSRFNKEDQGDLNALSIQFTSYNFNDSTWVKKEALIEALPILKTEEQNLIKNSNTIQLQDSLGVYLVKIEDVLTTNDVAPLSFIKPTIKQIILNKRKLELIRKLEKDITKDAIKNNKFETY